jgi:hypothetical protein
MVGVSLQLPETFVMKIDSDAAAKVPPLSRTEMMNALLLSADPEQAKLLMETHRAMAVEIRAFKTTNDELLSRLNALHSGVLWQFQTLPKIPEIEDAIKAELPVVRDVAIKCQNGTSTVSLNDVVEVRTARILEAFESGLFEKGQVIPPGRSALMKKMIRQRLLREAQK